MYYFSLYSQLSQRSFKINTRHKIPIEYWDVKKQQAKSIMESWNFSQIKTSKEITVPFVGWSQIAIEIAAKYNYQFPQYTPQYFNRALKMVCRNAGITESVTFSRSKGSDTILIKKQKCDLVSSHTARRTAVSMLLEKGIPPTVVMKITGHSSIQTMMRYERTSNKAVYDALGKIQ